VHLHYLYNEPTNAQLINNLLYCSLLHCPYRADITTAPTGRLYIRPQHSTS